MSSKLIKLTFQTNPSPMLCAVTWCRHEGTNTVPVQDGPEDSRLVRYCDHHAHSRWAREEIT